VATMQSLQFIEAGSLAFREVPEAQLRGELEALVRPIVASVCDIDRPVLAGTSPWQGPFAFGHEAVGEVVEVGDRVKTVQVGDLVAIAWHINCGVCDRCVRGLTAHCRAVPPQAMYGLPVGGDFGGLFDDLVRVPYADAMLRVVPAGVDPIEAVSAGDNLSLGYQVMSGHIAAGRRRILVLGSAAVGINQVAFATALGAVEVVYVDDNPQHRVLATQLGAIAVPGPPDRGLGTFDLVVDVAFNAAWLRRGVRMVEPGGVVESLGGHLGDVELPLFAMYSQGVTLRTGVPNNGPYIAPTLAVLRRGVVKPSTWSQPFPWSQAAEVLREPALKPVAVRERKYAAPGGSP
jgi:threonine dehydrogenase-like Zn-dependent dehydrogenase